MILKSSAENEAIDNLLLEKVLERNYESEHKRKKMDDAMSICLFCNLSALFTKY